MGRMIVSMRRLCALVVLVVPLMLLAGETGASGVRPLSAAGMQKRCRVPNVKGKTLAGAKQAIKSHHCGVGTVERAFSSTVAKGLVISQRPRPGARRTRGSRVSLVVSKGAPLPSAGTVAARVSVAGSPLGLLALPGAVWVAAHRSDSIYRIDTRSNSIVAHVAVAVGGEQPARMVFGGGTLFEENYSGSGVSLIDPVHSTLTSTIHAPLEDCCWPAYGAGSLWLLEYSSSTAPAADRLVRLDSSGQVLMTMTLNDAIGLTFGAGSVWGSSGGQVFRLDPATNQVVAHISTDAAPIAFGAGSLWGLSADNRHLVRIDPATNSVSATIGLPAAGSIVAAGDGAVWVAEGPPDSPGSHLWKIDPATNHVVGQVKLGGVPSSLDDLAVGDDGDVWVSEFDTDTVVRVQPTS
jgi:streptogramin lyase